MKTDIYTIGQEELKRLGDKIPDYVAERADERGFYTLGAFEKGDDNLIGFIQFYVSITEEKECFGEMIYVYVSEENRRKKLGSKLAGRAVKILKKSGIGKLTFIMPKSEEKTLGYQLSNRKADAFFRECGFFKVKREANIRYTTVSDILPDIRRKEVTRYLRLTDR